MKWITHIGVGAAVAVVAFLIHSFLVNRMEKSHAEALAALRTKLVSECDTQQKQTLEDGNALEANLVRARAELNRLRNQSNTCIVPRSESIGGTSGPSNDPGLSATYGITAFALREFAFDAEEVGLRLDACQAFLRREYHIND